MRFFALIVVLLFGLAIGSQVGALAQQPPHGSAILASLAQPVYPTQARQLKISGDVSVSVTIYPDGKTQVALESGPPMLIQAALESAKETRFECKMCHSKISHHLVYSFQLIHSDCCDGMSVPVQVTTEPESVEQDEKELTRIIIRAEEICPCDPLITLAPEVTKKKKRAIKCLYLWRCS